MRERRARQGRRRAREFEAFVAGAAGRLLHAATLLTGEPLGAAPAAERLLVSVLARTYVDWSGLHGDDPYEHARQQLAARFAHSAWRYRRPRGGPLDVLPPQERLVLVLRLYEGVAEEQTAASLGLPVERVKTLCVRGMATLLSRVGTGAGAGAAAPAPAPGAAAGAVGGAVGAAASGGAPGSAPTGREQGAAFAEVESSRVAETPGAAGAEGAA